METNILSKLFLPLALFIIMLGMGLNLTPKDFKRVFVYPKAALLGLVNQMIILPLIGFGLAVALKLPPELAVGLMILAACPGGATSNLITNLSKGDVALSITLTAISSFITVLTIPFIANFSLWYFMSESEAISLPVLKTIGQVVIITIVPVSLGMVINKFKPNLCLKVDKTMKIFSALFLVIIILGSVLSNRENLLESFALVGIATLILNLSTYAIGYGSSKLFRLDERQTRTVAIESGIQNATLGIAITTVIMGNAQMAISPAIYGLIMLFTAAIIIFYSNVSEKLSSVKNAATVK
ncbi:MAG: bile acid:sodium symporter family protein [Spirochaetales bacterium]|nr:bile acid:sodium symporter family protein [Spirochaetales bacterium]